MTFCYQHRHGRPRSCKNLKTLFADFSRAIAKRSKSTTEIMRDARPSAGLSLDLLKQIRILFLLSLFFFLGMGRQQRLHRSNNFPECRPDDVY
jgi:hypothetical protein